MFAALIRSLWNIGKADIVFVGYMGHFLAPLLRFVTKKVIVFDAFLSLYDMLCYDREYFRSNSLMGKVIFFIEKLSYQSADRVIIDTDEHKRYLVQTFGLEKKRVESVYLGADETVFYDRGLSEEKNIFRVHFHGKFIPLQGTEYIVKAAKLLEGEKDIVFHLWGGGQTFKDTVKLAEKLRLTNVRFEGYPSLEAVAKSLARSHLSLGIFGHSDKAKRVIPTKGYETLAMKKPLLTGDSAAIKELLENNVSCYTCKFADEKDIAKRILEIRKDQNRIKVGEEGYRQFKNHAALPKIREKLLSVVESSGNSK